MLNVVCKNTKGQILRSQNQPLSASAKAWHVSIFRLSQHNKNVRMFAGSPFSNAFADADCYDYYSSSILIKQPNWWYNHLFDGLG